MFNPRPYQLELIEGARQSLKRHNSVLLQAPTGTGKTATAANILQNAVAKGSQCFFIVHRVELIDQSLEAFEAQNIECGIIASGYAPNPYRPVQICSIDTLKNRLDKMAIYPKLIIQDECHHQNAAGWAKVFNHFKLSKKIGLSATPERLDGQGLGDLYQDMVCAPQIRWFMDNINPDSGLPYLSDYKMYGAEPLDLSGVKMIGGDFAKNQISEIMDKPSITGDIISHYKQHALNKKFIGFATSIAHSERLAAEFMAQGITCVHLDGKTDKHYRRAVMNDYKAGNLMGIFNVGLLGEGVDVPAAEVLIDAAPSQSLAAVMQRRGRVLRPHKDKPHAIILDHAGNYLRHGYPDDDRHWSLMSKKRQASEKEKSIPTRQCGNCYHLHKPSPTCPQCGYIYPIQQREVEERSGELQELTGAEKRKQLNSDRLRAAKTFPELLYLANQWNIPNPEEFAKKIIQDRKDFIKKKIQGFYAQKKNK